MEYFVRESLVLNKVKESLISDIDCLISEDRSIPKPHGYFDVSSLYGSTYIRGMDILETNIPKVFLKFNKIMELVKNSESVLNGNLVYLPVCFVSGSWGKKPPMELKPIYELPQKKANVF